MGICPGISLLYGNMCSSVRTCSSRPFPPTDVPSLRISTTRSGRTRKYCHTACDDSTQSSLWATVLSGQYAKCPDLRGVFPVSILWPLDHGTHPLHLDKHDGYRGEDHQIAGYAAGAGEFHDTTTSPGAGQCFRCCLLRGPPPRHPCSLPFSSCVP